MRTLDQVKRLLHTADLAAVAREAGCHLRTVYRIKDGDISRPNFELFAKVSKAAAKHQKPAKQAA